MPLSGSSDSQQSSSNLDRPERALAVAALGLVVLAQPFLGIFDRGSQTTLFGIPVLFAYLFIAWACIVALTALVMERRLPSDAAPDPVFGEPADLPQKARAESQPDPSSST